MLLSSAEQGASKPSRVRPADTPSSSTPDLGRPRRQTVQSDIQDTIQHPGNVLINVQGAFIVDDEQPGTPQSDDYEHDPQDIRLPNHTTVVSHVAVDVRPHYHARVIMHGMLTRRPSSRLEALWPSSSTSRANLATTRSVAG